jgi:hypothetical protein
VDGRERPVSGQGHEGGRDRPIAGPERTAGGKARVQVNDAVIGIVVVPFALAMMLSARAT